MSLKTITIHLIDLPGGGLQVLTTAATPHPGERLTPAQALATDLLNTCSHRASDVRYWQGQDKALQLVQDLLHPEGYGWSINEHCRDAARRVLGIPPVQPTSDRVELAPGAVLVFGGDKLDAGGLHIERINLPEEPEGAAA